MTTFVTGAFDRTVLAGFGRRIIVRQSEPGVQMVDVDGVDDEAVAAVLREVGTIVLDAVPAAPAPETDVDEVVLTGPAPAVVDLTPVLDAVLDLRADLELMLTPDVGPVVTQAQALWLSARPWLGGAVAALLVELVARLH